MIYEKTAIISDTNHHSGSIQEIKYVSSSAGHPIIEVVSFGTFEEGNKNKDSFEHQRYAGDITLTPRETIDGPITSFKLVSGAVQIKYNRELNPPDEI